MTLMFFTQDLISWTSHINLVTINPLNTVNDPKIV